MTALEPNAAYPHLANAQPNLQRVSPTEAEMAWKRV